VLLSGMILLTRKNIATPTPADANLNGGLCKRRSLAIPLCRPSSNPILKRRRSYVDDIAMVLMSEAGDPLMYSLRSEI
jgi:hypothetical protein